MSVKQEFLSLTADEIMVLTDRVLNHDRGTEDMFVCAYPLLLRLGSAYVEMLGNGKKTGEVSVAVSEPEAWLLRSKITSGDKSSADALFGVKLLTKIYKILLAYNLGLQIDTGGADDEFDAERKAALERWMGKDDGAAA